MCMFAGFYIYIYIHTYTYTIYYIFICMCQSTAIRSILGALQGAWGKLMTFTKSHYVYRPKCSPIYILRCSPSPIYRPIGSPLCTIEFLAIVAQRPPDLSWH